MKKRIVGLVAIFLLLAVNSGSSPISNLTKAKPVAQIIFLEETEVEGRAPQPMSTFSAKHLTQSIRPFTINKNVRPLLAHYEPRDNQQQKACLFYDVRNQTQHW